MAVQRIMVAVDESDVSKRQQIESVATNVLATYATSMLVEVADEQLEQLEAQGFTLEIQKPQVVKLRTVEIDTTQEVPPPASALRLNLADMEVETNAYWLVQFVGPVKPEWGEQLNALGASLHEYVPDNAFLVSMTTVTKNAVAALPFVQWVGVYEPVYKVSPLLMGRRARVPASELSTLSVAAEAFKPAALGNIVVVLHEASDIDAVSQVIEQLGGTIVISSKAKIRASLEPEFIAQIANLRQVKWIEPYALPELVNDEAAPIIGVQPVWDDHGLDGSGQIVAVADSGLDTGVNDATMHDDFEGRIIALHSLPIPAGIHGYLDNASWDDGVADVDSGHGTHVAGSVLGGGTLSGGDVRGMAPEARLVFQATEQWADWKALPGYPPDGYYLLGIPEVLNDLFQQAYDDGARIHTNSWGGHQDNWGNPIHGQYNESAQEIDEFAWEHKDFCIIFAAGNEGRDADNDGVIDDDSLNVQPCAKNCISVGASENNRAAGGYNPGGACSTYGTCWPAAFPANPLNNDGLSDNPEGMVAFSSRGPTDDGRIKPDVVAPGTNILSTRSSVAAGPGNWGELPGTDARRPFYWYMGGTSMSAPITAGTIALIRQYLVQACLHDNPSAALLKAVLIHGATPLVGQYAPAEVGPVPDNSQGWGRVNLDNSLFPPHPVKLEFVDDPTATVGTGEQQDFTFEVVDTTVPFRATLAWTDFPSDPATGGGLVNTLRLSVISPTGTVVQGEPANNNVQQVVIDLPQVGTYTVRVTGINVATLLTTGERQDFALVIGAGLAFTDLYIRDNAQDTGVEPSLGTVCQSPDIWVSLDNDPAAAPVANPEFGQVNYVFIRVRNRGTSAANTAQVRLYWSHVGTHLSRPHWQTTGIQVDGVDGNLRTIDVPAHSGAGDGEAITAAFAWTPPDPGTAIHGDGHFCLFATVDHPDDPLLQEDVHLVRWEDNLAWKNVVIQDMVLDAEASLEFYVAGVAGASSTADLHIDRHELPRGGTVKLKMPSRYLEGATAVNLEQVWQSAGGRVCRIEVTSDATADLRGIRLNPGENSLLRLEATLPEETVGDQIFPIFVEQRVNGTVTGRVTLVVRSVGMPAFIANRNSGELHLPDCRWVTKMSGRNKVPFNDLERALRRGYNGCRFCLAEYDTD